MTKDNCARRCLKAVRNNLLFTLTLAAVAGGLILGKILIALTGVPISIFDWHHVHFHPIDILLNFITPSLGVIVQQTLRPRATDMVVVLLKFPGEILLRMLKCVILPLVVASVITGLGAINAKSCGKETFSLLGRSIGLAFIHLNPC